MHLTTFTEHAFRVLMYLAKNNNDQATIQEISESYQVSRNHIAKVVHQLGLSGFILTNRGARGGIRLAKDASEICAGDVVKEMEKGVDIIKCFDDPSPDCPFVAGCKLKTALIKAREGFLGILNEFTLADLVADDNPPPLFTPIHATPQ